MEKQEEDKMKKTSARRVIKFRIVWTKNKQKPSDVAALS